MLSFERYADVISIDTITMHFGACQLRNYYTIVVILVTTVSKTPRFYLYHHLHFKARSDLRNSHALML